LIFSLDQLNSFFTSTQNGATINRRVKNHAGKVEFAFSNTFDLKIFNSFHQIKSNAIGLDGVPLKFLKLILPRKTSKRMPIPKKKSQPSNMSDYRPISVLPALSKAIEIIMKRQINAFLMDKGLLRDYQPGFRTHHSTSTALLKITNDLLIATDERLVSLLVLLNFCKVFGSVNHHFLCSKLSS
jgi:hypothetical protein